MTICGLFVYAHVIGDLYLLRLMLSASAMGLSYNQMNSRCASNSNVLSLYQSVFTFISAKRNIECQPTDFKLWIMSAWAKHLLQYPRGF